MHVWHDVQRAVTKRVEGAVNVTAVYISVESETIDYRMYVYIVYMLILYIYL